MRADALRCVDDDVYQLVVLWISMRVQSPDAFFSYGMKFDVFWNVVGKSAVGGVALILSADGVFRSISLIYRLIISDTDLI